MSRAKARLGQRFAPPPFDLTPEITWVLMRAFGPASVRSPLPLDGEEALSIARALDLGARIAARNDRAVLAAEIGAEAAEELLAIRRAAAAGGLALSASIAEVVTAAENLGLPVVFLKYAALELSGRLLAGSRAAGDVDVLVPSERAQELQQALCGRGYAVAGSEEEHQLPALVHPRFGAVEVHRSILGLRLDGVRSASYSDLAERKLLEALPAKHLLDSATIPVRSVLAAHAIVHGIGQHGGQPRAYPFLKMVADLLDLGVELQAKAEIATWLSSDVSGEEIAALFELANELAAGRPRTDGERGAAVLLRHALLGAFDAEYRQALKLEFFAAAPSDRERSLLARVRAALFLSDRQIDAIYGAPPSRLGYFGRRVARPFDLVLRAFAARSSARALARRRGRASAHVTPRKPV